MQNVVEFERAKYDEIWALDDYRKYSPGLENVERFMAVIKPPPQSVIFDIGCGTGCAGLKFEELGMVVRYVDLTDSALDPAVDRERFVKAPIWNQWAHNQADYAFCCDVMEHIAPEFVMLSLERIIASANVSWLQICNAPDQFGAIYGKPLHLTVQPFTWWLERLRMLGDVTDARDLCGTSLYVVRR